MVNGRVAAKEVVRKDIHGNDIRERVVNGRVVEREVEKKDIFGNNVTEH